MIPQALRGKNDRVMRRARDQSACRKLLEESADIISGKKGGDLEGETNINTQNGQGTQILYHSLGGNRSRPSPKDVMEYKNGLLPRRSYRTKTLIYLQKTELV